MKLSRINKLSILMAVFYCSSCSHDAQRPPRKSGFYPIRQQHSTLEIPITLVNAELERKLDSLFPDPIKDSTKNMHVDILNPAVLELVPFTYEIKKTCEILGHAKAGGWKCKINPACWVTVVVGHKVCSVWQSGMHWVEKTKATRISFDVPVHYKVRIAEIKIEGNADNLFVHVLAGYAASAKIDGRYLKTDLASCGFDEKGMAEVELLLSAKIDFDAHGNILLTNKQYNITWPKPCDLTALNITPQDIINLPIIQGYIDRILNSFVQNKVPNNISIYSQLQRVWPKISNPIKIDSFGYLLLNATQLNTTQLFASKDSIFTDVGAECSPQFIITGDTVVRPTSAMAQISNVKMDSGFNVNLLASVAIDDLNKFIMPLVDKYQDSVEFVHFDEIKLYQSEDSLVVQISLKKPFKGVIYLWGNLKFNLLENTLTLDHLEYTASSRLVLVKYANWLLTSNIIERQVQKIFKFKYKKKLSEAIAKYKTFNKQISPNIYLAGNLDKVSPAFINISNDTLNVVVNLAGKAHLELK